MKYYLAVFLLFAVCNNELYATRKISCPITPTISSKRIKFKHFDDYANGNMIRKNHSVLLAKGEQIVIKGKILDQNCLPVPAVMVRIAQLDHDGGNQDKNFSNQSFVVSNNAGAFSFLTIKPGVNSRFTMPVIFFQLEHKGSKRKKTAVFFSEEGRDDYVEKFIPKQAKDLEQIKIFVHNSKQSNVYDTTLVIKTGKGYRKY